MAIVKLEDLTGQKYGRLTVLSVRLADPESKDRSRVCFCRCECGKTVDVKAASLKSGNTKSCGCITTAIKIDLTGTTSGALTYVGEAPRVNKRNRRIRCSCACGNTIDLLYDTYVQGKATSCGCIKRQLDIEKTRRVNSSPELTAKRQAGHKQYLDRLKEQK
jgi:hypothetical protein